MPRSKTPTLQQALDTYLASRYDLAESTRMNDRSVLTGFVRGLGADRLIGNITALQVERWFQDVAHKQNPKPASYNKVRQRVSYFLSECGRRGWVRGGSDLMAGVKPLTVPRVERVRLTGQQLRELPKLLVDPVEIGLVHCATNTGLRGSEITALKVGDVNLDEGTIAVWRSKTNSADRMGITPALDSALRVWLTAYARELGDMPLRSDMHLFPARRPPRLAGGNPGEQRVMTLGSLQPFKRRIHAERIVQKLLPRIGIEVSYQEGIHTLRRSAARVLFEYISEHGHQPGYDSALRVVSSFLGHKNTATTEIYLGLDADRSKRDTILRDGDFLPPEPTASARPGKLRAV